MSHFGRVRCRVTAPPSLRLPPRHHPRASPRIGSPCLGQEQMCGPPVHPLLGACLDLDPCQPATVAHDRSCDGPVLVCTPHRPPGHPLSWLPWSWCARLDQLQATAVIDRADGPANGPGLGGPRFRCWSARHRGSPVTSCGPTEARERAGSSWIAERARSTERWVRLALAARSALWRGIAARAP